MGQLGEDARTIKATDQNGNAYALPLAVGDRVRLFAGFTPGLRTRARAG